ncbi:TPA: hypothetical protein ROX88_003635 [Bacillus pseudomycoides]|nr:hypothetical protein [Bacillus pseudomycoides]
MPKKLIKPMLHIILFCTVFLFSHTYEKDDSLTRYLLVTVPILIIGMFGAILNRRKGIAFAKVECTLH